MIADYSVYELSRREKIICCSLGYTCIAIVFYLFYHSLIISLPSGLLVGFLLPVIRKRLAYRRMNRLNMQFKDMLYSLSSSIAAGRQMEEALVEAEENLSLMYDAQEPIMRELHHMRICIEENKESDRVLLQDFARRSCSEDIDNFVQVYVTCRNMGGDMERIIANATDILTDKINIEREIKVITDQKKTEGRMISAMPLMMLLMMNIFSYSYIAPLYTCAAGRLIMTGALAAILGGICLMEKFSQIDI